MGKSTRKQQRRQAERVWRARPGAAEEAFWEPRRVARGWSANEDSRELSGRLWALVLVCVSVVVLVVVVALRLLLWLLHLSWRLTVFLLALAVRVLIVLVALVYLSARYALRRLGLIGTPHHTSNESLLAIEEAPWRVEEPPGGAMEDPCLTQCEPYCMRSRLLGLQCPYTWQASSYKAEFCIYNKDRLFNAGTPYSTTCERLVIAYGLFCGQRRAEARAVLVACYVDLLPYFDPGCGLVRDYKPALRHVLDATWAGFALAEARERGSPVVDRALLAFIQSITPFDRLDRRQQAAVHAIHARFVDDKGDETLQLLRKAVRMSPDEGEWRTHLGWQLQEWRGDVFSVPSAEERSMLRSGYRLRKTVNSITRLARSLAEGRDGEKKEAQALMDEALRLHPRNPAVYFRMTQTLPHILGKAVVLEKDPARDRQLAERLVGFLRQALALAGESAMLRMNIATTLLNVDPAAAQKEMNQAMLVNPEASIMFREVFKSRISQMRDNAKTPDAGKFLQAQGLV